MNWIKPSDKLPSREEDENLLVHRDGEYFIATYADDNLWKDTWFLSNGYDEISVESDEIDYWTIIPELPNAKKD